MGMTMDKMLVAFMCIMLVLVGVAVYVSGYPDLGGDLVSTGIFLFVCVLIFYPSKN